MNRVRLFRKYFTYLFNARNEHSVHSPFLFDFYVKAIKNKIFPEEFLPIEKIRRSLLKCDKSIQIRDFGAGSLANASKVRKVKDILKSAEKPLRLRQLLFHTIQYFQPSVILDIGTSFGITTMAQAVAVPHAKVYTFEGCPETVSIAKTNFSTVGSQNIELIEGNFDDTLESRIQDFPSVDYVFFDGNHRLEPTLRYFNICLEKVHNDAVFIFDDIHWSEEMEETWAAIKNHSSVTLSLDFFFLGMVLFKRELSKEHFILKL